MAYSVSEPSMTTVNTTSASDSEEANKSSTTQVAWWPAMCSTPLLPGQRPSALEIFMPPAFLTAMLIAALVSSTFYGRRKSKKVQSYWDGVYSSSGEKNESVNIEELRKLSVDDLVGDHNHFYTDFDLEVLGDLNTKNNKFSTLIKLCIPSLISLSLSSCFMFTHEFVFNCMWPLRTRPDINTAVTCFLAPAGLVYALSFGFTFQQVLEKHRHILNKITHEMSMLDQMITMTEKFNLPTKKHAMAIYKAIKSESVFMAMQIQKRGVTSFKNPALPYIQVHIWHTLDILRDAASHPEYNFNLNRVLVDTMVSYIIQLNSICGDRIGTLHSKIHPLKWTFLEVLGTVTLFGVMLIDAQSRRMEVAICELTVFSVSMLCYVLADLDSAFNGFFRVNTSVLPDVVKRSEELYNYARIEWQIEQCLQEGSDKKGQLLPGECGGQEKDNFKQFQSNNKVTNFNKDLDLRLNGETADDTSLKEDILLNDMDGKTSKDRSNGAEIGCTDFDKLRMRNIRSNSQVSVSQSTDSNLTPVSD